MTTLVCQAPHPHHGRGIHGARLAIVASRAEPTDELVESLGDVPPGNHGAWCQRCRTVSVYRLVRPSEAA